MDKPVALVTGASRGIGRAFALKAATEGYHVIALARTTGGLEELDDEIKTATGQAATLLPADLARTADLAKLGYGLNERFGRLDLFAGLAAASAKLTPTWQMDPTDFERTMAVNATANLCLLRTLHPLLKAAPAGGRVLFADGGAPEPGRPFWASYAASKATLSVIAQTHAQEMVKQALSITLVDPGATATALRKSFYPGENVAEMLADGRLRPPEVAAARLWDAMEANHARAKA